MYLCGPRHACQMAMRRQLPSRRREAKNFANATQQLRVWMAGRPLAVCVEATDRRVQTGQSLPRFLGRGTVNVTGLHLKWVNTSAVSGPHGRRLWRDGSKLLELVNATRGEARQRSCRDGLWARRENGIWTHSSFDGKNDRRWNDVSHWARLPLPPAECSATLISKYCCDCQKKKTNNQQPSCLLAFVPSHASSLLRRRVFNLTMRFGHSVHVQARKSLPTWHLEENR